MDLLSRILLSLSQSDIQSVNETMFPLMRKCTERKAKTLLGRRLSFDPLSSSWHCLDKPRSFVTTSASVTLLAGSLRTATTSNGSSRHFYHDRIHRFPTTAFFSTIPAPVNNNNNNNNNDDDDDDTAFYKHEMLESFRQDLPHVRELIFSCVQEEEELLEKLREEEETAEEEEEGRNISVSESEKPDEAPILPETSDPFRRKNGATLRVRFDEAWTKYCHQRDKERRKKHSRAANTEGEVQFMGFEGELLDVPHIVPFVDNDEAALLGHLATSGAVSKTEVNESVYDDRFSAIGTNKVVATTLQDELEQVCLLLETSTQKDWLLFDKDFEDSFDGEETDTEDNIDVDVMEVLDDNDDDAGAADMEYSEDGLYAMEIDADETVDPKGSRELMYVSQVFEVLEDFARSSAPLCIDDYNLLLGRVATSPEFSTEEVMAGILEIYRHILRLCVPDETTYRILLLTLERRISADTRGSNDATMIKLLEDMMNFKIKPSSPTIITVGMRCLDRKNNLEVAQRLVMEHVLGDKNRRYKVPANITRSLMRMIARENELDIAVSLLNKCIEEHGRRGSYFTDQTVDAAIRWPDKNRAGQRRDITHVLKAIRDVMMDNKRKYDPGFSIWRNIIVALSRTTEMDPTRYELLRRPYHSLFKQHSKFYPDNHLLRLGIEYCVATNDADLARTLIVRAVDQHTPPDDLNPNLDASTQPSTLKAIFADFNSSRPAPSAEQQIFPGFMMDSSGFLNDLNLIKKEEEADENSNWGEQELVEEEEPGALPSAHTNVNIVLDTPSDEGAATGSRIGAPFSFKVFQSAIEVCLAANDLESCQAILGAFEKLKDVYPQNIQAELWSYALQGFAGRAHDTDAVRTMFNSMEEKGIVISEESCGAILHSLAVGGRPEEVSDFFLSLQLKSSENGSVAPGLSCYNAVMLSHLNSKAWEKVLSAYEEMSSTGITANDKTTQALLIASYRLGGSVRVRQLVEDILSTEVVISRENCHLALKILIPNLLKGTRGKYTVDDIQERLRDLGDKDVTLRSVCLNLLRSFRQAETEQNRLPTKNAPLEVLVKRREEAWQNTLRDILEVAQAQMSTQKNEEEEPRQHSAC